MILLQSRVQEIRRLSSDSGTWKQGHGVEWGTGTARATGNLDPPSLYGYRAGSRYRKVGHSRKYANIAQEIVAVKRKARSLTDCPKNELRAPQCTPLGRRRQLATRSCTLPHGNWRRDIIYRRKWKGQFPMSNCRLL